MNRFILLLLFLPSVVLAKPLSVFVSVPPLKTFVEKVGGQHVEVNIMVRPGHSPATYNPTPQQISRLSETSVYFRIGVPFEHSWIHRIQSANPDMEVIDTRNGLMLRKLEEHHDHEHEESLDPHIWTSPVLVQQILHTISNALSGHMPEHKQEFENNRQKYQQELTRLDNEIRELLQPLASKPFLVFHPGWGYFADTYHLVQIVVEQEGKEPGAHSLAKLIEQAKQQNIRIVFVQPQFSRQLARQLAHAIDGDVISIDPLADDYVNNLRQVARQLAATLQ